MSQVILRRVPSLLTEVKLKKSDESVLDQLSRRFDPRHYKLDLKRAPLLRLMAAPTGDGSWIALQLMHHMTVDHVTEHRLSVEIQSIIDGHQLPPPTPFRHVIAQTRLSKNQAEHIEFFSKMLADVDTPTLSFGLHDLPNDGIGVNEASLELPQELNLQLRAHARQLRVSLASLCHLAWAQVIASTSGNETVVFGTVLLGRLQSGEGNESAMGLLINTLPFRMDMDNTPIESALRLVHSRLSALLGHEYASLALAQRCSGVPNNMPLFNALLNYRHNSQTNQEDDSPAGVDVLSDEERSNYPLYLSVDDNDDGIILTAQVSSPISATRLCAYMQQALESIANKLSETPQQPLRSLPVIPLEEREMLLNKWNATEVDYSPIRCLHQLFEEQVKRDGAAIAVECDGVSLTYAELNAQANQLAHHLIARGVKPDDRIAVCVKRSTKMIVALLGILKSGGAYLPLDPVYSSQRLTNILKDAEPLFLLVDTTGQKALGDHQVPLIDVDEALPADLPVDNPKLVQLGLTSSHLAYVMYTSGSTGTPKGVMIEHGLVVNLLHAMDHECEFTAKDVWCLFHSFSFDVSVSEICLPWSYGGKLVIVPQQSIRSPSAFYQLICEEGVTVLYQTPGAWKAFQTAETESNHRHRLRYMFLTGDKAEPVSLKRWFKKQNNTNLRLLNVYGPTETNVTTSWKYDATIPEKQMLPIGRPLPNVRLYVLDTQGEPVPLGAEGELYIGGAGVARGYLNRPDLTADRFLPDPFSDVPGARMYRTGDRARYLPDGNLVYLGRTDQQLKIRGFRIEPGEIEARLAEHPVVREAVVLPWKKKADSDTQLVVYVVADLEISLTQNLRTHLASLLPDYMVPAAYVSVSSLPLTTNGKIDRRALPAPDEDAFARQSFEAPRGEMEEKLAALWSELLGIDRISRHDNFFALGGHSLLVMQFTSMAKRLLGIRLDTRGLFQFPILKAVAERITQSADRLHCDFAIPVRVSGDQSPLFMLPDGYGDISYAFELAREIDQCFPVYALPWSSPEKEQPASIEEMAKTMISRIKQVQPNGPCAIAGYSAGGVLAYEISYQLLKSGNPVSFLGLFDTCSPTEAVPLDKTDNFLEFLAWKSTNFKALVDTTWWTRVSQLSISEAVKEAKEKNIDLLKSDIEWEAVLTEQRAHYIDLCIAHSINPLSIRVNLFKATECSNDGRENTIVGHVEETSDKHSKLGWENYEQTTDFHVISVSGDHFSMLTDPVNRAELGNKLSQALLSKKT